MVSDRVLSTPMIWRGDEPLEAFTNLRALIDAKRHNEAALGGNPSGQESALLDQEATILENFRRLGSGQGTADGSHDEAFAP